MGAPIRWLSAAETERLAALLRETGAEVTLTWQAGGHNLTRADITSARSWLQEQFART